MQETHGQSPLESRIVRVLMPEGRTDRGVLLLHEDSHGNDDVGLTLQFDNDTVERWSGSFWSCLQQIRVELEAREMKLVCYGTSRNVHPSGMQLVAETAGSSSKPVADPSDTAAQWPRRWLVQFLDQLWRRWFIAGDKGRLIGHIG